MEKTQDLTQGKALPQILRFYFPMFFTNMLQQVYNIADTAIVGKGLGDDPLAAVGNMASLCFLIVGFSVGLANGFCVPIAHNFGAKNYNELRKSTASAIKLSFFLTIILTLASILYLDDILVLLQTSPYIFEDSLTYGYIIFGGLITTISYNLCAGILRSLGDSTTPFIAIVISTLTNIALNCLFIFGCGAGVEGVAIATIIAQILSTLICLHKLSRIQILKLHRTDFATDYFLYGKLLKNGVPMALMNSITAVGCMVVQYFVNGLGVAYTTAYSVCSRYVNMFIQPSCTAGYVMSSFTSQNHGANRFDRIQKGLRVCVGIAAVNYILLGTVLYFFPEFLARLMVNGSKPIELICEFLPPCGAMMLFINLLFVYRSGVQGLGKPFIPMLSGIMEMIMRISVIYFGLNSFGFAATAYADIAAWIGALAMNLIAYYVFVHRLSRK